MNTLLEGPSQMAYYTDLALVFEALGGRQREYNWLITAIECNYYPPEFPAGDPKWLSGEDLTAIVARYPIQFEWAVLSGFTPDVHIDTKQPAVYPYADGNPRLWQEGVTLQHPMATVEIVCWDASATLLLSKDDDLTGRFRTFFPEAVDLDEHNRQQAWLQERRERRGRWTQMNIKGASIDQVLADCDVAISKAPDWPATYLYRAQVYASKEQYDLALRDCDKARSIEPAYVDAYFIRGRIHKQAGETEQAVADFKRILEMELAGSELRQEAADQMQDMQQ